MAPLGYVYALKFYCPHDMHFMPRAGVGAVRGEFFAVSGHMQGHVHRLRRTKWRFSVHPVVL